MILPSFQVCGIVGALGTREDPEAQSISEPLSDGRDGVKIGSQLHPVSVLESKG
jgi:hypothetical protein